MSLGNGVMERPSEAVEGEGMFGEPQKNRVALSWRSAIPKNIQLHHPGMLIKPTPTKLNCVVLGG